MRTEEERIVTVTKMALGQAIALVGIGATFEEFKAMKNFGRDIARIMEEEPPEQQSPIGYWIAVTNLACQYVEFLILRHDMALDIMLQGKGVKRKEDYDA